MIKINVIDAALGYVESHSPVALSADLWPAVPMAYQAIWADRFRRGLAYSWSKMDLETRARFVDLALEDYANVIINSV